MRTLGQSQRGSTHTREFEDTAWKRLRNAAQTSTCCCGRRPSPQQSTIGAKSMPLLRKQLSQLITWQLIILICRSRWGAEIALPGARLRLSRAYLTFSAQSRSADKAYENTSSTEFDPSDCTWYAAGPRPFLGDHLRGKIGTSILCWSVGPSALRHVLSCSIPFPCVFFLSMPLAPLCPS